MRAHFRLLPSIRSAALAGLLVAALGCTRTAARPEGPAAAPAPTPESLALHVRLFAAAERSDVPAFKAVLTRASVALLDGHIEVMRALSRPRWERPFGWREILRLHAALPEAAKRRAGYPAVREDGILKLDIAGHPDAGLFRELPGRVTLNP